MANVSLFCYNIIEKDSREITRETRYKSAQTRGSKGFLNK